MRQLSLSSRSFFFDYPEEEPVDVGDPEVAAFLNLPPIPGPDAVMAAGRAREEAVAEAEAEAEAEAMARQRRRWPPGGGRGRKKRVGSAVMGFR